MRLAAAFILLGAAACTEPAIDVHLALPSETTGFDYSCITAVDVLPIAPGDNQPLDIGVRVGQLGDSVPCIDLQSPPSSIADFAAQLRGRLDAPMPDGGLDGIELRARAGDGGCAGNPYEESILYGGGMYDGSSRRLTLEVSHNLSCSTKTTVNVHPVDMLALVQNHTCAPAPSGTVFTGDVRPTHLDAIVPEMFETGPSQAAITDAVQTAQLATYGQSFQGTCLQIAYDNDTDTIYGGTCVNTGMPVACGAPGDIEVPYASGVYQGNSVDAANAMVTQPYGSVAIGAVVAKQADGTVAPVPGATITLDSGASATVVYGDAGDPAVQTFAPAAAATATTASGMFMLYFDGLTGITVAAPDHPTRHLFVGSGEYIGTVLVVLE